MANPEVEKLVDDLIRQGRVTDAMRSEYVSLIEKGLGDHLLRGSDYTNKTKELAEAKRQAQAAFEAERQKLMTERQKLDSWYGTVQGELQTATQLREEKEAINARLAAAEQALRDYQIYDQVTLPSATSLRTPSTLNPSPTPSSPQAPPEGKWLARDEFDRIGAGFLNLMDKVTRIQAQHYKLFGEPLDDNLVTHFQTTGEDPEQYWRVKYAVDNRKAELQAKTQEAERAKMKEELRTELMREYTADPSKVVGGPFGTGPNKGGLTPVLDQFGHSRATAHSQPHANDNPSPKADDFVPPEKRPEIQAAQQRIAGAQGMYSENFDQFGNPTTERGRQLFQKYQ